MRITANDIRKMETMTNDETVAYLRRKMQPNVLQRVLRCISVAAVVLCIAGTAGTASAGPGQVRIAPARGVVTLIPPARVKPAPPIAKMQTPAHGIPRPIPVPRHHIPFHK